MPMRLRLSVKGTRNDRIFHLVAINQRTRRDGKPTELLGVYDPRVKPGGRDYKTMEWSVGRIRYWLDVGAVPSKSVVKLLTMGNILMPGSPYHPKSPSVLPTPTTILFTQAPAGSPSAQQSSDVETSPASTTKS